LLLVGLVRLRPQGLISERPLVHARPDRPGAEPPLPGRDATSKPPTLGATIAARPPTGQAAPLAVEGVSKAFGGLRAVDDLSLRIEPGRVTAIIGPNGAGKTTLFNILTGYLHPDQGQVRYGGHDLTRLRPFEIARLGIARSFQDVRVFSRMTVLENVVLTIQGQAVERLTSVFSPSRWALREQERARQRALELLGAFGLLPFADERVANLSYAQQKLLVVVTLVARDDPLILLDELAAGLDHDSVAAFSRLVREMAASGRTVCLIEHNLDFVWQTAGTVLVLDQGRLIARPDRQLWPGQDRPARRHARFRQR
jgi:ABC-type branched-subunit amino acid transport system ATPase component